MNWAWFDGRMPIEHYEHEHPLDTLAIIKASGSETEAEKEKDEQPLGTAK
jgi:hypothetical protein